jgi:hypothetical protein
LSRNGAKKCPKVAQVACFYFFSVDFWRFLVFFGVFWAIFVFLGGIFCVFIEEI